MKHNIIFPPGWELCIKDEYAAQPAEDRAYWRLGTGWRTGPLPNLPGTGIVTIKRKEFEDGKTESIHHR